MQADLDVALNVFDQGQTYPLNADATSAVSKTRNQLYADAQKLFEKVAAKDDQNPICWTAKAWAARCLHMLGDFPKAKERYKLILAAEPRYAADAIRLTRYFNGLLLDETSSELRAKGEDDASIIKDAKAWISDYPGFLKTPEGYGVRFLLAEEYVKATATEKDASKRAADLADARRYFRQVEESENDFTDRARREKIDIIAKQQGGFKEPVGQLKTFEDCYVRAQFELIQQAKGEKEAKTPEDAEKVRKEHADVITAALERGLKLADESKAGHGDEGLELANAKAMMTYQYMNAKKYREAVALGEKFAKNDPRSSQAAAAAVYVLLSYVAMVDKEAQADKPPAELPADRKSLFDFARYMEQTWPKEPAGDMARHQLALLYINARIDADDPDAARAAHVENVQKAIEALGQVTPNYAQYIAVQYQLAQFCFAADKEKLPPLPGDAEDGYRKRALAALANVPEPAAGADPTTNRVYFLAKIRLAQEDFTAQKYDDLGKLTEKMKPLLAQAKLNASDDDDKKMRGEFEDSLNSYSVLAHWGLADAEARAAAKADPKDRPAHYENVLKLLDPVVDDIKAHKHPELKNNQPLARGVLDNALRATIQLNKLDRTRDVLDCYKELAPAGALDGGASEVLKELVAFIPPQLEELKHKGDAAALEAAKKEYSKILADTLKPLGDKLPPTLVYYTAKIYSSLDQHKEAAELLETAPEPTKPAPDMDVPDADKKMFESIRLALVRERRLNGEADMARKLMDEILGDAKKPGWGRKEIPALLENVEVLAAQGDNKAAAERANGLAQQLLPNIETNPRIKEIYLQCNYLTVENVYRQAVKLKDKAPAKYAEGLKTAASLAADLAKNQLGFVNDATRDRFRDLMDAPDDQDLKDAFLEAYLTTVEGMDKQAAKIQGDDKRERAYAGAASLVMELEKMWPDYGGDAAKARATALLTDDPLKKEYDKLKGAASAPVRSGGACPIRGTGGPPVRGSPRRAACPRNDRTTPREDKAIMKRIALAAGLAACLGLFAAPAGAEDVILRRDPANAAKEVNVSGTITAETPAGVKIQVGKDVQLIPPDDIRYIGYDVKSARTSTRCRSATCTARSRRP